MTNKEQLQEEFLKTLRDGIIFSGQLGDYIINQSVFDFFWSEIEKRDKGNNAFKKWIIEKLEEGKKIAANEIGNLEAKIQELEAANKKGACSMFCPDPNSTSATKCFVCGKEKIEHENQRG